MNFVDHDRTQASEHGETVGIAQQQRERFGRGEQDLRGLHPLTRLAIGGRVAGAGFDANVDAHFIERRDEIPLDVDRQRLERRDVKGVQPLGRLLDQFGECRQETGERLAGPSGRNEKCVLTGSSLSQHVKLMATRGPAP